jgi:predicted 3-demethylubiquinone-9 3-methyltransferase (glyoxalase superfamily)
MPQLAQKIVPQLWYASEAVEAAKFYVSILPDSKVNSIDGLPVDTPSGPAGSVRIVDFTLCGQHFLAFSAPTRDVFNPSVSFQVMCDDQAEVDRYWDALIEGGGRHQPCGWLRDRWGVAWQILPKRFTELMADPKTAKPVAAALMKMGKIVIAELEAAAKGA